MAEEIKCILNDPKEGKSYSKTIETTLLSGRTVGEIIPGNLFGLTGYEFKICGGSDSAGFPMRPEKPTHHRKRILVKNSIGAKIRRKGMYKRKTVRGNIVSEHTAQINMAVSKYGTTPIKDLLAPKEEKAEESKK